MKFEGQGLQDFKRGLKTVKTVKTEKTVKAVKAGA
jgi:hypothetical protein